MIVNADGELVSSVSPSGTARENFFGANCSVSAWPVFHDEGAAQAALYLFGKQACHHVVCVPRRGGDYNLCDPGFL